MLYDWNVQAIWQIWSYVGIELLGQLKKAKIEFLDLEYLLFDGIFLSGIGGYTPLLTDNHCAQKSLAERGGTPPLNGQNPLSSF